MERTDRKIPEKVIRKVFSPEEYREYKDDPIAGRCRKEAACKISGRGMIADSGIPTTVSCGTKKLKADIERIREQYS